MALAEALERERADVTSVFLGSERGVESRILPERGLPHRLFPVRGLERSKLFANVGIVLEFAGSVRKVRSWFKEISPALVVATGGYASAPWGLAASRMRIPLVLQEQNSYPGATTRLLSRWATQIHLAFPEAERHLKVRTRARVFDTGNPIRSFDPLSKAGGTGSSWGSRKPGHWCSFGEAARARRRSTSSWVQPWLPSNGVTWCASRTRRFSGSPVPDTATR